MLAFNKNLKTAVLLTGIAVLGGCGLADTDPVVTDEDKDAFGPRVVSTKAYYQIAGSAEEIEARFSSNFRLPHNFSRFNRFEITFNEAIQVEEAPTINKPGEEAPGSVLVKGLNGSEPTALPIDGKPQLQQKKGNTLTIPLNLTSDVLPLNTIYSFKIARTVKDLDGNPMHQSGVEFRLSTPAANKLVAIVRNLAQGENFKIVNTADTTATELVVSNENGARDLLQLISTNYREGTPFALSITQQPDNQYCTIPMNKTGTMGYVEMNVLVYCASVLPAIANAPLWNDYVEHVTDDQLGSVQPAACLQVGYNTACRHGGELRKFVISQASTKGFTNGCTDVQVSDNLSAFNWICKYDSAQDALTAYSTGLAPGKRLADLLNASQLKWHENAVTIRDTGTGASAQSGKSVWWENPIVNANRYYKDTVGISHYVAAHLNTASTIYLAEPLAGYNGNHASEVTFVLAPKIAYVVPRGRVARALLRSKTIQGKLFLRNLWIEGDFDFSDQALGGGHELVFTHYSKIRNVSVKGASGFGIRLENSFQNHISQVALTGNGKSGLIINNFKSDTYAGFTNRVDSVLAANNGVDGIKYESGIDDVFSNIRTAFNKQNGFNIVGGTNLRIDSLNTYNNATNGILVGQSVAGTSLLNVHSASNDGSGILLAGQDYSLDNAISLRNALNGIHVASTSSSSTTGNFI
ncbi:MAG: hypothetical protein OEX00_09660, partial [Gammaproteobacteria bacterium]|nr:hypothetical protein [Gammaproteobacteria bacterium]